MFDITSEAVQDTATLDLHRANGSAMIGEDGKRASITLCGPGSQTYIDAVAETRRRARQKVERAGGRVTAAMDGKDEDEADFLAAITVSFNNFEYPEPEGVKFKTKREQYAAFYMDDTLGYLREQVQDFRADWGNFAKS